jgi:hypothetical protein
MVPLEFTAEEFRVLMALSLESPWRFSNGIVAASVSNRFYDPLAALELLIQRGFVAYEFYGTGAVHEYAITEDGKIALRRLEAHEGN